MHSYSIQYNLFNLDSLYIRICLLRTKRLDPYFFISSGIFINGLIILYLVKCIRVSYRSFLQHRSLQLIILFFPSVSRSLQLVRKLSLFSGFKCFVENNKIDNEF